jgi:hypothetical protein
MVNQKRPAQAGPAAPVDPEVARAKFKALLDKVPQLKGGSEVSPQFGAWESDVLIALKKFYGENSEEYSRFESIWFTPGAYYPDQPRKEFIEAYERGLEEARLFLESRKDDWPEPKPPSSSSSRGVLGTSGNPKDVFVVHGHNHGIKETVARFLSKIGLNPIILHEKADEGNTIIEKFEKHSDVSFAIAIFSGDDLGASKATITTSKTLQEWMRPRARQNVVFEFGYFMAKLGRKNVVGLVEEGVETPSDYSGVLYIPYDAMDGWRLRLVKELKAAGLDFDSNAAFEWFRIS